MEEVLIDAALGGADGSGIAFFFLADHFVAYDWDADRIRDGVRVLSPNGRFPCHLNLITWLGHPYRPIVLILPHGTT